jgi:hypothetical protein
VAARAKYAHLPLGGVVVVDGGASDSGGSANERRSR